MTEFERDSILLDLIDDLLLSNEYEKVDTLLWWCRGSTDLQLLAHLVGFTHAAAAYLPTHELIKQRYQHLVSLEEREREILSTI